MNAHEVAHDALVEDAIEILIDRSHSPSTWRERNELHERHDRRAFELLAEATEPLTARALADLLTPTTPPPVPSALSPSTLYAQAEQRRREWNAAAPDGWINPDAFARCLSAARAALIASEVKP